MRKYGVMCQYARLSGRKRLAIKEESVVCETLQTACVYDEICEAAFMVQWAGTLACIYNRARIHDGANSTLLPDGKNAALI